MTSVVIFWFVEMYFILYVNVDFLSDITGQFNCNIFYFLSIFQELPFSLGYPYPGILCKHHIINLIPRTINASSSPLVH